MSKEKRTTGIILPVDIMEHLDKMAHADFRDRSAEIAVFVNAEWERRYPPESRVTPAPPKRN